jgi:hypothetical protein
MNLFEELLIPLSTIESALLVSVAMVLVFGIPAVMASARLPRQMQISTIAPDQLTAAQRKWFEGIEARLRTEGYREALTFSATNLGSNNLNRAYISDSFPAMCMATAIRNDQEDVIVATSYVEFVTEFEDGGGVTTRSQAGNDLFEPLPGSRVHVHRYTRDPLDLKHEHDEHCKAVGTKQPVFHAHDEFAAVITGYHERWIAHQTAVGLLAETRDGQFRATFKLALRGVMAFFNPFEESFDLWKGMGVLLGGIALPMLAGLMLMDARMPLVAHLETMMGLGHAVALAAAMAPVMWLSGGVVGAIFPNNTFLWPALCAWLGSRVFLGEAGESWMALGIWLFALLLVPLAAGQGAKLKHRLTGLV